MTAQLMTQAEFARHRGVSKGCVTNWKNAKPSLLVMQEDERGRIKVNVERSEARLNANIDPVRGRPSTGALSTADAPPGGGEPPALPLEEGSAPAAPAKRDDIADERVQHLREQRIGQAMKNAQLAGELVPLIEAERRVSEVGRAARERIHSWFRGVAERLAAEKDIRAVMALGENGIDQVFAELASAAERGDFAGNEGEPDLLPGERAELEAVDVEAVAE